MVMIIIIMALIVVLIMTTLCDCNVICARAVITFICHLSPLTARDVFAILQTHLQLLDPSNLPIKLKFKFKSANI